MALAVIEGADAPLEPSVIAARLIITTGSMTSVLDTLEKRGLIRRLPHPDDRRKLLVEVTDDASRILDNLLPSLHLREVEVIGKALTADEQYQLLGLLVKVQRAARAESSAERRPGRRVRQRRSAAG